MKSGDLVKIKGSIDPEPFLIGVLVREWNLTGFWEILVKGQLIHWPASMIEVISESR